MKLFLTSLAIFLFVVGSWCSANFFLFQEERTAQKAVMVRIADKECILNELAKIENLDSYQKKYGAILNTELGALEKRIPPMADSSQLIDLLNKIAAENRVEVHDYQVGEPFQVGVWKELPLTLTLMAPLGGLSRFLNAIAAQERLMLVRGLKIEAGEVEIQLVAYFGIWPSEAISTLPQFEHCGDYMIPVDIRSVLVIPPLKVSPLKLQRDPFILPEDELHLVGVALEGTDWIALLEDEHGVGQVYKVGDSVTNGYVVKQIFKGSVFLAKGSKTKQLTWSN